MAIERLAQQGVKDAAPSFTSVARRVAAQVEARLTSKGIWRGLGETLGILEKKKGLPAISPTLQEQLSQAHRLVYEPYVDLRGWKFHEDMAPGEKGVERTFWVRDLERSLHIGKKSANTIMAAHERMNFVVGAWLDLPVNKVQLGHFQLGKLKDPELISVHQNVGRTAQKAYRVHQELGFKDSGEMDFRTKRGNVVAEFVTGPSNWGHSDLGVRYARVQERVVNPEIFDRIQLFDRLMENTDRHGSNYMATVAGKNSKGERTYAIHLIDHGRTLAWHQPHDVPARLAYFQQYLDTLDLEFNRLHLGNILPDLRRIAALTDQQLDRWLFLGITEEIMPKALRENEATLLKGKRDQVRAWLNAHESYLAEHFTK